MSTPTLERPSAERAGAAYGELDLFRVFAFCFSHPTRECFAWLSGNDSRALWKHLKRRFRIGAKLTTADRFTDFSAYEATYIALFEVGVPGPPVPLLESAHSNRSVPQEIVLDCVNFYDVLGLRPSGSVFPTDHLVTQLEFLAAVGYLREGESDPEKAESLRRLELDFFERHLLNWLPVVQEKIDKLGPPLFPTLIRLLTAYLKEESRTLAQGDPR